jgi:hypothetical protein
MTGQAPARVTHNFDRNLESIRAYLEEKDRAGAFDALLDQLFETVIPNIERFPKIGFDFLARKPLSFEGAAQVISLRAKLGEASSLREYIFGDYLILYAVREARIDLLAIKHHLQLSFDLRGHWDR